MSDHFDNKLKRRLASDTGEIGRGVSNVRRIELITGTGRRRRWSRDDKARIVEESLQPGATVSEVARRNGLSPQQLFAWRRAAHALFNDGADTAPCDRAEGITALRQRRTDGQARPSAGDDDMPAFAPVVIAAHPDLPGSASKASLLARRASSLSRVTGDERCHKSVDNRRAWLCRRAICAPCAQRSCLEKRDG